MRKLVSALACRNQGSRLYGKPLQNLDINVGVTILDNIVQCLSGISVIDAVVLGISEGNDNVVFAEYAKARNLPYIVGDESDVLSRLVKCGEHVQATDIFRTTSESPFPFFDMIEEGWKIHCETNADATFLDNMIDGCGFEIIRLKALQISHDRGDRKHRSELCTLYIRENKKDFKIHYLKPPKELARKDIRFTVDYPEDLIVCRAVYTSLKQFAPRIPLLDAVKFVDRNEGLKTLIAPFCEEGYKTMYL